MNLLDELSSRLGVTSFATGEEEIVQGLLEGRDVVCIGGSSVLYEVLVLNCDTNSSAASHSLFWL